MVGGDTNHGVKIWTRQLLPFLNLGFTASSISGAGVPIALLPNRNTVKVFVLVLFAPEISFSMFSVIPWTHTRVV